MIDTKQLRLEAEAGEWDVDIGFVGRVIAACDELDAMRKNVITQAMIQPYVDACVVRASQHPNLPLTLYSYTSKCEHEKLWDDVTVQCRGLVMHGDRVVARPFKKFFNYFQHSDGEIPWHLPCEITEKMDGSLLIVFNFQGEWLACTKGSFISQQAFRGLDVLDAKYGVYNLCPEFTYCFEFIAPWNRIVVDYGDQEDVILTGLFHTATGHEIEDKSWISSVPVVRSLPRDVDAKTLRSLIVDGNEGYVVRFSNGFRVKVKGDHYLQLHSMMSGISSRSVWEYLSEGKPLDEVLAIVPEECAKWILGEADRLKIEFKYTEWLCENVLAEIRNIKSRREQYAVAYERYPNFVGVVMQMLDGKKYDKSIWKLIYPKRTRPINCAGQD